MEGCAYHNEIKSLKFFSHTCERIVHTQNLPDGKNKCENSHHISQTQMIYSKIICFLFATFLALTFLVMCSSLGSFMRFAYDSCNSTEIVVFVCVYVRSAVRINTESFVRSKQLVRSSKFPKPNGARSFLPAQFMDQYK